MKILYIHSDKIVSNDILWGLLELEQEPELYDKTITLQQFNEHEKNELLVFLQSRQFDAVMTLNFSETVSCACQERNVKYISWILDSPLWELYKEAVWNECNYIFLFDKNEYFRMIRRGLKKVFYLPLASNVSRVSGIQITDTDIKKYSCDISFVGTLYQDNFYNRNISKFPEEIKNYFNKIILDNSLKWDGEHRVMGSIEEGWYDAVLNNIHMPFSDTQDIIYFTEAYYLARKIAEVERINVLNMLAQGFGVHCYTTDSGNNLNNVMVHPAVDRESISPIIYHLSKINLNITLRSIETGVPQRVFDILGAGGFLLTNYQEELEELFVPDQEIVFFRNMQELAEKAIFYLSHDKERMQIAMNGYQRVKRDYSYPTALARILKVIGR